jgi:beta-phosphoglucomutase-like phosphatase (HAD superfamily)
MNQRDEESTVTMFDAVVFDCDGVLIDSEIIASRVTAEELTKLGFPLTIEECIQRFTGRPDREMKIELEEQFGRPIPASYDDNVHARITEAYATELKILPGLKEALATITEPVCLKRFASASKVSASTIVSRPTSSAQRWSPAANRNPMYSSSPPAGCG